MTRREFWSRVYVMPDGCWHWRGYVSTHDGYGQVQRQGRRAEKSIKIQPHRISYDLLVGKVPEGLQLDHLCRVRHCVNPAHLEPVTCAENLLRGETLNARNRAKTHCHYGHPLEGENLYLYNRRGRVMRHCRACQAQWSRNYKHRQRGVA